MEWKNVPYGLEDIGVYLMESITKGLYKNPLHVLREYIQNEVDTEPVPSWIKIGIHGKEVMIAGNGAGMDKEELFIAKRIGMSNKDPETQRGFRGIGIWSGVSVCKKIIVTAKKNKKKEAFLLSINAEGIKKEIENRSNKPLATVLSENVQWREKLLPERNWVDSGTAVQLKDILSEYEKELLDENKVKNYLELIAPIDFPPNFKYRQKINDFLGKNVPEYMNFELKFNDTQLYRQIDTSVELLEPIFGKIEDEKKNVLAYYWICLHEKSAEIKNENSRRIIFKNKGMTIGNRNTIMDLYKTRSGLANWVVGEIHVISKYLIPNTEREYFEVNPTLRIFEEKIMDLIQDLECECDKISKIKNTENRIKTAKEMCKKDIKFDSEGEITKEIGEIERLLKDFATDLKSISKKGKRGRPKGLPIHMKTEIELWIKKLEGRNRKIMEYIKKQKEKLPEPEKKEIKEEEKITETPKEEEELICEEKRKQEKIDIIENFTPKIDGLCSRVGLNNIQKDLLIKIIRILFSNGFVPNEKFDEFLGRLELELNKP